MDSAEGDFVWANGSTASLGDIAEVIDAWRSGVLLVPLRERFPFIEFSEMAEGYERGEPVETAWRIVLADDNHISHREMLAALRSNSRLNGMFPFFSHNVLRLAIDPYSRDAGEICIELQGDGRFSVQSSPGGAILADVELADLADMASSFVDSRGELRS
ncbi:DUF6193 family natural product biosynthesis protein [Streptomyces sp. NPDC086787]|uniref:DUF6193 family natural product biosynthesis protein n=1 Tax=Streptomyces sp. NPDC086787 TaxID=3365759 RepID=UPI00380C313F